MLNIVTGYGVDQVPRSEIVILVSSLSRWRRLGVRYVFTDRHAYLATAQFYSDDAYLTQIDWELLRARDMRRDPDRPDKFERLQAEALAYHFVPTAALYGIACYDEQGYQRLAELVSSPGLRLTLRVKPDWYV